MGYERAVRWRILERPVAEINAVTAPLTRESGATLQRCHHECLSVGLVEVAIDRHVEHTGPDGARIKSNTDLENAGDCTTKVMIT